jgi:hypothetical protein
MMELTRGLIPTLYVYSSNKHSGSRDKREKAERCDLLYLIRRLTKHKKYTQNAKF